MRVEISYTIIQIYRSVIFKLFILPIIIFLTTSLMSNLWFKKSLKNSRCIEIYFESTWFQSPLLRGYPPPSSTMLFDDDPGIMSEVETSSTGFRRGGKQRSSLPVVRTPSKTLERPLGNSHNTTIRIQIKVKNE